MSEITLKQLSEDFLNIGEQINILKVKQDKIKEEIKKQVPKNNQLYIGNISISRKIQITKRFDVKSFKDLQPKTYEQFVEETESDVLRIRKDLNKE